MPPPTPRQGQTVAVDGYIAAHWHETVRHAPDDDGTLLGLPRPYTVPSAQHHFQEMYYWDTYYTNLGLIAHGQVRQAQDNVECLAHLVTRFGYVPNGNRTYYLKRSQPPHLALSVADIYAATGDRGFLARMLPVLETEYGYWQRGRMTGAGLCRYLHDARVTEDDNLGSYEYVRRERLPLPDLPREQRLAQGIHYNAECESGWDFTPRFGGRCSDCCPVDLNAWLFSYETVIADARDALGAGGATAWRQRAAERRALIDRLCWDESRGFFYDYDVAAQKPCALASAAAFVALWTGCASQRQADAMAQRLDWLEHAHGLSACAVSTQPWTYQWDHPNAWAPLQYAAVMGLMRYGHHTAAARLAGKWVETVARNFAARGALFEKYNAVSGDLTVNSEYGTPAMLGWTAGVYAALLRFDSMRPGAGPA